MVKVGGSSPPSPTLLMSRIDLFVDVGDHVEIQSEEQWCSNDNQPLEYTNTSPAPRKAFARSGHWQLIDGVACSKVATDLCKVSVKGSIPSDSICTFN